MANRKSIRRLLIACGVMSALPVGAAPPVGLESAYGRVALEAFRSLNPAPQGADLPDTPEGRRIAAFDRAFNAGREAFLAALGGLLTPGFASKFGEAGYQRLARDFGVIAPSSVRVLKPHKILCVVPTRAGAPAALTFTFEGASPYRISGLDVTR